MLIPLRIKRLAFPSLLFIKGGNIPLPKPPLLPLLEGRQYVLPSELIHRIRAPVQNSQLLCYSTAPLSAFQSKLPLEESSSVAHIIAHLTR
jgi:hypothetical protein